MDGRRFIGRERCSDGEGAARRRWRGRRRGATTGRACSRASSFSWRLMTSRRVAGVGATYCTHSVPSSTCSRGGRMLLRMSSVCVFAAPPSPFCDERGRAIDGVGGDRGGSAIDRRRGAGDARGGGGARKRAGGPAMMWRASRRGASNRRIVVAAPVERRGATTTTRERARRGRRSKLSASARATRARIAPRVDAPSTCPPRLGSAYPSSS